ncbi:hypothetical protein pb186bvf_008737 [Paramecium bursaria]
MEFIIFTIITEHRFIREKQLNFSYHCFNLCFIGQLQSKKVLLIRHGARAPVTFSELEKQLWVNYEQEQLTEIGFEQQRQLGIKYQDKSIFDVNGKCIYQKISIVGSYVERCIISTIGFIKGLCPLNYDYILRQYFEDYWQKYSINDDEYQQIIQSDFQDLSKLSFKGFIIENDFLFHGHEAWLCQILDVLRNQIKNSFRYQVQKQQFLNRPEFNETYRLILEQNPSTPIPRDQVQIGDITGVFGSYSCSHAQGFDQPNPSETTLRYLEEVTQFDWYEVDNSQLPQHQAALTKVFEWIIQQIESDKVLSIYEGHDSNLFAALSVITDDKFIASFASVLEFDVQGENIMTYFNGVLLRTNYCENGYKCKIQEMKEFFTQFMSPDLNQLSQDNSTKKIVMIRHGARSPTSYSELEKELWAGYRPGQLTEIGFEMEQALGKQFRDQRLYDKNGNCIYDKLHIVGSYVERCVLSTVGFIQGLCPLNYAEILRQFFDEYWTPYSTNIEELAKIIESDFTDLSSLNFGTFHVTKDFLFHGTDSSVCKILDSVRQQNMQTFRYNVIKSQYLNRPEFDEAYDLLVELNPTKHPARDKVTLGNLGSLYSSYRCSYAQGFNKPDPSPEALAYIEDIYLFNFFEVDNGQLTQHQSALTEVFKWINQEISSTSILSLYSGHDSNLVAALSVIIKEKPVPYFASSLEFRVINDQIQTYFNGKILNTNFCENGYTCKIEDVRRFFIQFISDDLDKLCTTTEY